jgi:hypothetical protein
VILFFDILLKYNLIYQRFLQMNIMVSMIQQQQAPSAQPQWQPIAY